MTTPDLLPLAAAAEQLHVSKRTLEREARDGRLRITRIRSVRLVARDELARYIAAATSCPSAAEETAGRSVSALEVDAALSALSRRLRPAPTRGRSKLRSAARRSTLRLVRDPGAA